MMYGFLAYLRHFDMVSTTGDDSLICAFVTGSRGCCVHEHTEVTVVENRRSSAQQGHTCKRSWFIHLCNIVQGRHALESREHPGSLLRGVLRLRRSVWLVCDWASMCEEQDLNCNRETSVECNNKHEQDTRRFRVSGRDHGISGNHQRPFEDMISNAEDLQVSKEEHGRERKTNPNEGEVQC